MFQDTLKIGLELGVGGATLKIAGANLKRFELELRAQGFSGQVEFWISDLPRADEVLPKFNLLDRTEVRLTIEGVLNLPDPAPDALSLTGLCTEKVLREQTIRGIRGEPVLQRLYTLSFADPATVLWKQHFPNLLDADATLEEVIKQQVVEGISLTLSWDRLKTERPIICLGLGEGQASFHDYLAWLTDRENGYFYLDYDEKKYVLSSRKASSGSAGNLRSADLEGIRVRVREVRRHNCRVQNAYAENAQTVAVIQDQGVTGLYRDVLIRTSIAGDVDQRKELEAARLTVPRQELELTFQQYPTAAFWPGRLLQLQREFFSSELQGLGKPYRSHEVHLAGRALEQELDRERDVELTRYELELVARCESLDDPQAKLPPYQVPTYPVIAEGKVVCEIGEIGDRPYMIYQDEKTSEFFYKVKVPLWNKEIMVPFSPDFVPGHFYIPAYKDSRVLLALHPWSAEILRFLDWGADVRLPAESQGNHLLFGKNKTSETSVKHVYVDSRPMLSIRRIANGDLQLVEISEGSIVLETKEDASLKKGEDTLDLSAEVAAAGAKLAMQSKAAIGGVSGAFEQASSGLNQEIDGAVAQTRGALDGLGSAIAGKAEEVTGQMEAAAEGLAKRAGELASAATSAKAELEQALDL